MMTAQEHATVYWAERPVKKWVVTLQGGGTNAITKWTRQVHVSARDSGRAIRCAVRSARANALVPSKPRYASARLATWLDLGCSPTQ